MRKFITPKSIIANSHRPALMATAGIVATLAVNGNAAIIATTAKIDQNDPAPTVSSTDLGQTAALSYSATGATSPGFGDTLYVAAPGEVEQLFNGVVGNTDGDNADDGETGIISSNTFTVNFDVSTNTLGYDITGIFSVAGWNTSANGRSNQGYDIDLTFVDNSTAKLSTGQTWEANNPVEYWTTVSLTNNGGGVLTEGSVSATGVKSITFSLFDNANANGFVTYREFDIIGTATVPEPASLALMGLGGLLMLGRGRRDG